jgi:ADP-ribose pyrophosphatase YjhB (NUDIX family)
MIAGKDYIGVGCGAFILNENNELLLHKRSKSPEIGYWSIPGGKVEMFEKFEDAVKREIKEETDLDIEIIRLNGICDHIVDIEGEDKVHWITPSYVCRVAGGIAKIMEPTKHSEMGWFSLSNLPDKLTIPTKKAVADFNRN